MSKLDRLTPQDVYFLVSFYCPNIYTVDTGEIICQQFCSDVYDDCEFFIYNRKSELCELFDYDKEIYANSCTRIGGTPQPNLSECKNSTDPCLVRKKYIHMYKYRLMRENRYNIFY